MEASQNQVKHAGIPFSFFVSLLRELARIPARTTLSRTKSNASTNSPRAIVKVWIETLRRDYSPLSRGTTASVLRLLFPEDDPYRKFGLQEPLLAKYLGQCLDSSTIFTGGAICLRDWNQASASGCLGEELLKYAVSGTENAVGPKSLQEIDALLDELASTSLFSDKSFHEGYASSSTNKRSKSSILRALYDSLPATDAAFLTQIILKDLRPLLYAPPSATTSRVLLDYNTRSKQVLTREQFMKEWDPSGSMIKMYKVRANLDEAAMGFEAGGTLVVAHPRWGVPAEVPKSAKGRSPLHALELLDTDGEIWAETKYDGERAQIHVRSCEDGELKIAIFSKSKRDSTLDRVAVHPIIKAALRGFAKQDVSVILDAEMVAFSDERNAIDEFWRIRDLVSRTAQGARATMHLPKEQIETQSLDTCPSLHSTSSESLHLALVFFDILLIGNASLLHVPYSMRRSMLESVIYEIPGQAMIAERFMVCSGPRLCIESATETLGKIWAKHIAECREGLVLKSGVSKYGDWRSPWVKLKKDYIPDYGDTIDLVVIAASWERDRARELRVPPSTLTTFYVGALGNSSQRKANPQVKPHFVVYFTASYGLSREQLEEFNFWLRSDSVDTEVSTLDLGLEYCKIPSAWHADRQTYALDELSYSSSMFHTLPRPSVLVRTPILVELCGAGFTKSPGSKYYELRFPRITKIFRSSERSYMECLTLRELQTIAFESVGRELHDANVDKDIDDWARHLWENAQATSQGQNEKEQKQMQKQTSVREEWESKFKDLDMERKKNRKRKRDEMEMSP